VAVVEVLGVAPLEVVAQAVVVMEQTTTRQQRQAPQILVAVVEAVAMSVLTVV
jgi:hypothetical protein